MFFLTKIYEIVFGGALEAPERLRTLEYKVHWTTSWITRISFSIFIIPSNKYNFLKKDVINDIKISRNIMIYYMNRKTFFCVMILIILLAAKFMSCKEILQSINHTFCLLTCDITLRLFLVKRATYRHHQQQILRSCPVLTSIKSVLSIILSDIPGIFCPYRCLAPDTVVHRQSPNALANFL